MSYPKPVWVNKTTSTFGGHSRNTPQVTVYQITESGNNIHVRCAPTGYPADEQEQINIRAGRFYQPKIIAALRTKEEVIDLFPNCYERDVLTGDIRDFVTGRFLSEQRIAELGLRA